MKTKKERKEKKLKKNKNNNYEISPDLYNRVTNFTIAKKTL